MNARRPPIALPSGLSDEQRRAWLWACAMHDAERGDTELLRRLVERDVVPDRHRKALAALIALVPKRRRGIAPALRAADVVYIRDRWKNGPKTRATKTFLAAKFGVSEDTVYDVIVGRNTYKWARALKVTRARSSATFTIGGSASGTAS